MITLASDFGTPYPAAMKGAVLDRCDARLVDIAHDFPRHDVRTAAFWLREILPEFPPAVHLVVVDPGVGTDRAALVVRAGDHALVGPDNGVLVPAARALTTTDLEVFELSVDDPASSTFHGRDVFAPAAADVHVEGVDGLHRIERLSPVETYETVGFPDPMVGDGRASGEVLVVDDFGNAITNVPGSVVDGLDRIDVDGETVPVVRSYAHVDAGTRVVIVGSHGNVECAINRGRGDEAFDLSVGDTVEFRWADTPKE